VRIDINGVLVPNDEGWIYDHFDIEHTTEKDVLNKIRENEDGRLDVHINSPGGDLITGAGIYAALQAFKGELLIHVVQACSAASVIACAGESEITRTGLFMVHNVSGGTRGDYREMEHMAEVLKQANRAVCAAYTAKTGLTEQELLSRMNAETWLTAEDAVSMGFIDRIAENKNTVLTNALGGVLPREVIEKMQNGRIRKGTASRLSDMEARRLRLLGLKKL